MTTTQTERLMELADRYAFHIPGSQHSDEARAALLASLQAREGEAVAPNGKLTVTLQDTPTELERAQYKRLFEAACVALGEINEALDLDPEDGGAEPILDAIEELKAAAAAPQPAQPTLKWCDQCGEGVTDFCRGKGVKCEYGFKPAGQPSEPAQPEQGPST